MIHVVQVPRVTQESVRQLQERVTRLERLVFRQQQWYTNTGNGVLIWLIRNINRVRREALQRGVRTVYSPVMSISG